MPVTALSARQELIAVVNVVLFGIGVTGVTPSDKNCAVAGDTARPAERMIPAKTAKPRRQIFCIFS